MSDLLTVSTLNVLQNRENIYLIFKYPVIDKTRKDIRIKPIGQIFKLVMMGINIV